MEYLLAIDLIVQPICMTYVDYVIYHIMTTKKKIPKPFSDSYAYIQTMRY